MDYLGFAWIASLAYGLEVFASKLVAKHSLKNPWLFNFVWSSFILVFTLPLALSQGFTWPTNWSNLLPAGILYTFSGLFYLLSLYRLDVSVISPLFNSRTVMSVLLGVWLLQEKLSGEQLVLISLIFFLSILVTLDERWDLRSFLQPAVALLLLCTLSLSLMSVYINRATAENGYWTVTLFLPVINQLILLLTWPKFSADWSTINRSNLWLVALIAVLGTIGSLAANRAYAQNVSLPAVIISLPISLCLAFFFSLVNPRLLESHPLKVYLVRFVSASLMIAAALRLSRVI